MTPEQYIDMQLRDLADVYGGPRVLAHARLLFAEPESSDPARTADPATSHASGASHRVRDVAYFSATSLPGRLLATFEHVALTAQEAALTVLGDGPYAPSRFDGCRRRVSDLAKAGFITDSTARRVNDGSKDESTVWVLTDVGRVALGYLRTTGWSRPDKAAAA